jgi:hypothetical protein
VTGLSFWRRGSEGKPDLRLEGIRMLPGRYLETKSVAQKRYFGRRSSLLTTRAGCSSSGAAGRSRTGDLRITNALLYQLSYSGVGAHYTVAAAGRAIRATCSAILENGPALLDKGRHAFLLILHCEGGVEKAPLEAHAFRERCLERAIDGFLGHHDHGQR